MVGNVLPEAASVHLPLISNFVAVIFTFGSITLVAVAISPPIPHPVGIYQNFGFEVFIPQQSGEVIPEFAKKQSVASTRGEGQNARVQTSKMTGKMRGRLEVCL